MNIIADFPGKNDQEYEETREKEVVQLARLEIMLPVPVPSHTTRIPVIGDTHIIGYLPMALGS